MTPRAAGRIPITKTPKVYIGGAFVRSESSRTFKISAADGAFFANIPQCTRKDLRNAVEAAAKAGPGWAKRAPYNRAQILYRLAEMLEARSAEIVGSLVRFGAKSQDAAKGTSICVDRLIHYAGSVSYTHLPGGQELRHDLLALDGEQAQLLAVPLVAQRPQKLEFRTGDHAPEWPPPEPFFNCFAGPRAR